MTNNEKQYYTVKLEVLAPVELTLRVLAESPQEAAEMVSKFPLPPMSKPPKPILAKMKRIKATVYRFGTTTYDFVKKFTR